MDASTLGQWVLLMFTPTLVIGSALVAPRVFGAARRLVSERRGPDAPPPTRPPIEELAADLRRLLLRYGALKQSTDTAMRAMKLRATEAAIADVAIEAAQALEVPSPPRAERAALTTPQLRRLLHDLAGAGLVVAPLVGELATDERP